MARPTYPGDLKDGRAVTANAFNSRVRPIFKTLDPSKVDGSGITSANIPVGSIGKTTRFHSFLCSRRPGYTSCGRKRTYRG